MSIVELDQSRKLLCVCWPDYKPVSCKFITDDIRSKANTVREQVKQSIGSNIVSITTDHWTSNSNHNYQGITIHWIDDE